MKKILFATAAAIGFMAASPQASANTYTYQQGVDGYTGTVDVFITETGALYEGQDFMNVGAGSPIGPRYQTKQALFRFDNLFGDGPGQIKPDEQIISATLMVAAGTVYTFTVYFYDILSPWTNTSNAWGGLASMGNQVASTPVAQVTYERWYPSFDLRPVVDVTASLQRVQSGELPGFGWLASGGSPSGMFVDQFNFAASEASPAYWRPLLTVVTAPIPEPSTYALLLAGLGGVGAIVRRKPVSNRAARRIQG